MLHLFFADTAGAGPLIALLLLVQVTILGWVIVQRFAAFRDEHDIMADSVRRIAPSPERHEWRRSPRPLTALLTMLGPALGMGISTLLGSMGMARLGSALGSPAGQQAAALAEMAAAFRDVSASYSVMAASTLSIVLGAITLYAARPIERAAAEVEGGDGEDAALTELRAIREAIERQSARRDPPRDPRSTEFEA